MKILRNPVWQVVAAVATVAAILVAVVLFRIGRPVKRLQVQILSNSPLISVTADISPQIQILYKARPVQAVSLILLRFENIGNEPIREGDYSEPVRVTLSPKAEVGEVTVQETKPVGIHLDPRISGDNQVEIGRALLNPGDQAVLKVLALNNDGTLRLTARIAGISELRILSALEGGGRGAVSAADRNALIALLAALVLVLAFALVWTSRRVMEWRRRTFGFDPASHYYSLAQEALLGTGQMLEKINRAIYNVGKACSWDSAYVARAETDPLLADLRSYEKFRVVLDKYRRQRETD